MGRLVRILCALTGTSIAVGVGLAVGALGWAHLPEPSLGVVLGVVAGIATSAVVRKLWSWRVTRVLVVLATIAHVVHWSSRGLDQMGARDPSTVREAHDALDWRAPVPFRVGFSRVPFTVPADAPLAGWGSGPRRKAIPAFGGLGPLGRWSLRTMAAPTDDAAHRQPLLARAGQASPAGDPVGSSAVVLRAADVAPLALVTLDTVTVDHELVAAIAGGVRDLGFVPSGLVVSATHTHSGPGGYSRQPLSQILGTGHFHEETFNALVHSAVTAVRAAHEQARPARVAIVRARDRNSDGPVLAMNRRQDDETIDDQVFGLRFDDGESGAPVALVLNYAVHPVVFRRRHPFLERDVVGAIEREVGRDLGAPVLFLNGALGDISPRPTPGDLGAERCAVLAKRFASVIANDVRMAVPHPRLHVAADRRQLDLGTPLGIRAWGDRSRVAAAAREPFGGDGVSDMIADVLTFPVNAFVWSLGLPEIRVVARFGDGVGVAANVTQLVPRTRFAVGSVCFTAGDGADRIALLWQPGEATQAVGRFWRYGAAQRGFPDAMIVGLANGACAYVTSNSEYWQASYEARATLFGYRAAQRMASVLEMSLDAARAAADQAVGK